jgi:hypothetical protein
LLLQLVALLLLFLLCFINESSSCGLNIQQQQALQGQQGLF